MIISLKYRYLNPTSHEKQTSEQKNTCCPSRRNAPLILEGRGETIRFPSVDTLLVSATWHLFIAM